MVLILCISSDDALYFFTKFHENVSKGCSELFSGQDFQYLNFQRGGGDISVKNVGGVMVLVLCLLYTCSLLIV